MGNFKRFLAVLLTATMVLGCGIVAFADETSGSSTGDGASEGHVDKKVINVILPTVPATSPFAYTMDPERLIQATNAGKYEEGTTFPAADADTGVYFLTGTKTYANSSNELQVINKSSHPIKLEVKVKTVATTGDTDIALATEALGDNETTAKLLLKAKVGSEEKILSATEQTVTKYLAGNESNFEVAVNTAQNGDKTYVYREKTTGLTAWKAMKFSVSGAVTNIPITATTTAPKVQVTWAYAEPGQSDTVTLATDAVNYSDNAAPTLGTASVVATADEAIEIPFNLGAGNLAATGIASISWNGADTVANGFTVVGTNKITIPAAKVNSLLAKTQDSFEFTVTFNDTAATTATFTVTKE